MTCLTCTHWNPGKLMDNCPKRPGNGTKICFMYRERKHKEAQ
jgi:hypothetical protein